MLNVALVGAGTMGRNHASCYREIDDVRVSAVIDIDEEASQALAGSEAATFTSIDDALVGADFEILDICTPTPVHEEQALTAIRAGKHLLIEKPLARTLEQCDRIIDAARGTDRVVMPAHVLRFFPEFAEAKHIVDSAQLGRPAVVHTSRGGAFPRGLDSWYADIDQSGGVTLDLIIHDFDWLRWCFGEATRVCAKGIAPSGRSELDYSLVSIRFASGVIAHVEGTWIRPSGFETKFEIACSGGMIQYSSRDALSLKLALRSSEEGGGAVQVPESPLSVSPYRAEIEHFVECVQEGKVPMVTLEDARAAVQIALAATESMKTGQPVVLQ